MLKNKSKLYIGIGMSCLLITQSVAYSLNGAKAMDKQSKQSINHQRVLVSSALHYNANGNMSTDNKGVSFSYNAANALTQVSLASGAKESDYYYANGLRAVVQSSNQVLVHYYSRNNQLLNTSDDAQQSSAYLIANNVAVRSVMGNATVLLHNRHGSVIGQLNNKPQFYQYSVYGVQKTADRGQRTENKNGSLALASNPLRYSGYMFDPLTGLYYLKARDYDPSLRSFIQADSYAFNNQGLINGYFYGNNNPLMGVDPSGHIDIVDEPINESTPLLKDTSERRNDSINNQQKFPPCIDMLHDTISLYQNIDMFHSLRQVNKTFKIIVDRVVKYWTHGSFDNFLQFRQWAKQIISYKFLKDQELHIIVKKAFKRTNSLTSDDKDIGNEFYRKYNTKKDLANHFLIASDKQQKSIINTTKYIYKKWRLHSFLNNYGDKIAVVAGIVIVGGITVGVKRADKHTDTI
ncbi:RHS repeat-associated core domain-containing protein [Cysteiniphilum halobium]|uniref:RHS repeat-associated core domain-containing protein n=1 Tax=Cysteiniphilum halobium TaxID=2219059 RepID=UPI000E64DE78|nr:RHS repeat-associated core domain-containing protein [Cysteiniphilum halobium]